MLTGDSALRESAGPRLVCLRPATEGPTPDAWRHPTDQKHVFMYSPSKKKTLLRRDTMQILWSCKYKKAKAQKLNRKLVYRSQQFRFKQPRDNGPLPTFYHIHFDINSIENPLLFTPEHTSGGNGCRRLERLSKCYGWKEEPLLWRQC